MRMEEEAKESGMMVILILVRGTVREGPVDCGRFGDMIPDQPTYV